MYVSALAQRRTELSATLDQVAGRAEWGVKAYASPGGPMAAEPSPPAAAAGADRPGMAYLRRRRAELSADERAEQAAVDSAEEVHAVLGQRAEAAGRHAPQDRRLSGQAGWMVLNGAYLVDAGAPKSSVTPSGSWPIGIPRPGWS